MKTRKKLFSIRMGYRKEASPQIESLNERTRVAFYMLFEQVMPKQNSSGYDKWCEFFERFSHYPKSSIFVADKSKITGRLRGFPKRLFMMRPWHDVLEAIEWLEEVSFKEMDMDEVDEIIEPEDIHRHNHSMYIKRKGFHEEVESILEIYSVGYAFTEGKFIPISNKAEADAVQKAAESTSEKVRLHIGKAISLLDRKEPDYANSIKESISAVEGILIEVAGEKKFDFKKVSAKLRTFMHPKFISVAGNLYQFTSDEGGVRHAIKDKKQQEIDQDAAVCMLVTCSAIANYLAAKAPQLKKDEAGKAADDDNIPF